jgi:hypothetical protein
LRKTLVEKVKQKGKKGDKFFSSFVFLSWHFFFIYFYCLRFWFFFFFHLNIGCLGLTWGSFFLMELTAIKIFSQLNHPSVLSLEPILGNKYSQNALARKVKNTS